MDGKWLRTSREKRFPCESIVHPINALESDIERLTGSLREFCTALAETWKAHEVALREQMRPTPGGVVHGFADWIVALAQAVAETPPTESPGGRYLDLPSTEKVQSDWYALVKSVEMEDDRFRTRGGLFTALRVAWYLNHDPRPDAHQVKNFARRIGLQDSAGLTRLFKKFSRETAAPSRGSSRPTVRLREANPSELANALDDVVRTVAAVLGVPEDRQGSLGGIVYRLHITSQYLVGIHERLPEGAPWPVSLQRVRRPLTRGNIGMACLDGRTLVTPDASEDPNNYDLGEDEAIDRRFLVCLVLDGDGRALHSSDDEDASPAGRDFGQDAARHAARVTTVLSIFSREDPRSDQVRAWDLPRLELEITKAFNLSEAGKAIARHVGDLTNEQNPTKQEEIAAWIDDRSDGLAIATFYDEAHRFVRDMRPWMARHGVMMMSLREADTSHLSEGTHASREFWRPLAHLIDSEAVAARMWNAWVAASNDRCCAEPDPGYLELVARSSRATGPMLVREQVPDPPTFLPQDVPERFAEVHIPVSAAPSTGALGAVETPVRGGAVTERSHVIVLGFPPRRLVSEELRATIKSFSKAVNELMARFSGQATGTNVRALADLVRQFWQVLGTNDRWRGGRTSLPRPHLLEEDRAGGGRLRAERVAWIDWLLAEARRLRTGGEAAPRRAGAASQAVEAVPSGIEGVSSPGASAGASGDDTLPKLPDGAIVRRVVALLEEVGDGLGAAYLAVFSVGRQYPIARTRGRIRAIHSAGHVTVATHRTLHSPWFIGRIRELVEHVDRGQKSDFRWHWDPQQRRLNGPKDPRDIPFHLPSAFESLGPLEVLVLIQDLSVSVVIAPRGSDMEGLCAAFHESASAAPGESARAQGRGPVSWAVGVTFERVAQAARPEQLSLLGLHDIEKALRGLSNGALLHVPAGLTEGLRSWSEVPVRVGLCSAFNNGGAYTRTFLGAWNTRSLASFARAPEVFDSLAVYDNFVRRYLLPDLSGEAFDGSAGIARAKPLIALADLLLRPTGLQDVDAAPPRLATDALRVNGIKRFASQMVVMVRRWRVHRTLIVTAYGLRNPLVSQGTLAEHPEQPVGGLFDTTFLTMLHQKVSECFPNVDPPPPGDARAG